MLVSDSWYKETAIEIMNEFDELLNSHDIKIENEEEKYNMFEKESKINKKEYEEVLTEVIRILKNFADYIEYVIDDVA